MDRQPLTDRLGDRLLAEYGGAAAAYSLRALNGNGDNVVRVRRASDNNEKDFTAEQIELGEMVNWVNSQTVPPLDIGVETSEGRIPVPEGGTSIGTPAVAYSLRNLSSTYTGNVVDVRRSSDDAVESFTATEVADGTLEDWVNTDYEVYTSDFSTTQSWTSPGSSVTITSEDGIGGLDDVLGLDCSGTSGRFGAYKLSLGLAEGEKHSVTFRYYTTDSSFSSKYWNAGNAYSNVNVVTSSTNDQIVSDGTWREVTLAFNNENSGLRLKVTDTSGGAYGTLMPDLSGSIYIRDVVLTTTHANGYVETWYDQSGNGNDATQTVAASQPKIVDAGVLVSGGIDFDGVDDQLTTSSFISGSNFSAFSVLKCTDISSNENQSWNFTDNASEFYGLTFNRNAAGNVAFASTTPDSDLGEESYTGNKKLFSTFSGTSNSYYSNGTESVLVKLGRHSPSTGNTIGSQGTSGRYLEGSIEEIIVYNSDQSANRTAIEANIGEYYGISGIPAYDNTVDGFVETWYDQSGNGNDATQTVTAYQPKIVDAGVLVSGGIDFDGTDDFLETNNSDLCNISELSLFTALTAVTPASRDIAVSAGSVVFGSTSYGGWALVFDSTNGASFQTQSLGSSAISSSKQSVSAGERLVTSILNVPNGTTSVDGAEGTTNTSIIEPFNNNTARRKLRIGCQYTFQASRHYSAPIKEVILYDSDQSSNREAIEANINNHYSIY